MDVVHATLGATKDGCDENLEAGWLSSCEQSYGNNGSFCQMACDFAVGIMYNAFRFEVGDFCPSCRAFENAQKRARR